jgi:hypothetical protein
VRGLGNAGSGAPGSTVGELWMGDQGEGKPGDSETRAWVAYVSGSMLEIEPATEVDEK